MALSTVFPLLPLLDIEISKAPAYDTKVMTAVSGKEVRVSWRTVSRTTYTLKFAAVRTGGLGKGDWNTSTGAWTYNASGAYTEQSAVQALFDAAKGALDSFKFVDPISGSQVNVRFVEDSIIYKRFADGFWAIDSLKLITVL